MKPELQEQEGSATVPLRTGEPVDIPDLHVGDELICVTKRGLALARVLRLQRKDGTVVGFVPDVLPGLNPELPIQLKKVLKAWRSPDSKRTGELDP
jgi:hypothetical protein